MNARFFLTSILVITFAVSISAAPPPATPADAPELTSRQKNLLLQLSDAEANIQAINKALVRTGYKVGVAYDRIDSNLKGNELMDRKGGGPVRWDEFYGKTAGGYARNGWGDRRPVQFDFVYRANNDQISRARDQIVSLERNQEALLARRRKHEDDQSRLWAILAFEQIREREIDLHNICRFALKPAGAEANVLRPLVLFLRTADRVAADGLDSLQTDQPMTFRATGQRMQAAYADLQKSLADALDAADLPPAHRKQAQAIKVSCKTLSEECAVIADNYANALDRDEARQDSSKLEFRAQLQTSLYTFATSVGRLDDEVIKTAKDWNIDGAKGTPAPDVVAVVTIKPGHTERPSGDAKEIAPEEKWVSLFNGKDFSGWFVDGGDEKNIRVEDGVIVASGSGYRTRSYLLSRRTYSNFILRLEFKPETSSGGGIALRAIPGEHMPGEKTKFFDHPIVKLLDAMHGPEETGTMIWIRNELRVQPDRHPDMAPVGSWNRLEIQVRGRSITVTVNQTVIAEMTVADGARFPDGTVPGLNRAKGFIGIQKHHGTIRYRNIEIMELPQ